MLPYTAIALNQSKPNVATIYELAFPNRSFISRISISEVAGGSITPTVDVFNKDPTVIASANREPPYRVVPQLTLVAGKILAVYDGAVPFVCHDDPDGRGVTKGKIYIRVNGSDTGDLDICVTGYGDLV